MQLFGDPTSPWRLVHPDAFGTSDGPELYLGRALHLFWLPCAGAHDLVGAIIVGDLASDAALGHADQLRAWSALQHRGRPVRALCDQRAMTAGPKELVALFERLGDLGPAFVDKATHLVAEAWAVLLWDGIARSAQASCMTAFVDPAAAWDYLDATTHDRAAVEALSATLRAPSLTRRLVDHLTRDPRATLVESARAQGMSPRSLQRGLALEGQSFFVLRTNARLLIAERRLAEGHKLSAVATDIGFSSPSHFARWFKLHRGVTPGSRR